MKIGVLDNKDHWALSVLKSGVKADLGISDHLSSYDSFVASLGGPDKRAS